MSSSIWDHSIETIEKALHIRKQIETLKSSLTGILGGQEVGNGTVAKRRGRPPKTGSVESTAAKSDGRRGKRSAATIAKMKAAQKARWAKKNGAAASVEPVVKARKKRTMSPEARARIAAAQRARWAKAKEA
jgi:hypothetical protein